MQKNITNLNPINLTAAALTGGGLRSFDLFSKSPTPENVSVSFRYQANGTAVGASKTLTINYALAGSPNLTVAELDGLDAQEARDLPNAANAYKEFNIPVILVGQRYLYLWFDHDAFAGGAAAVLTPVITA